jgi:hypothetical protein
MADYEAWKGSMSVEELEDLQAEIAAEQEASMGDDDSAGGGQMKDDKTKYCETMAGPPYDECMARLKLCGPNGVAAQTFLTLMAVITFLAQFLGYSVGSNWMPHPYMKQRPKIWKMRLKILVYAAGAMSGVGALCGLAGMSIWSGIQESFTVASSSAGNIKCEPGLNCPAKGFSYVLVALAVFINAGASAVFILQPRFFGKKFNVCGKIKATLFGKSKNSKKKKKAGLSDMYGGGGGASGGAAEEEDEEEEEDEDEEEDGVAEPENARFRV